MPSGKARELPVIMRVCGLRHLTQAKVQPFREQHIEQADLVTAWNPGSQMGKGFGESERSIDLKQDVGDPNGRHPAIEIEYQFLGAVRNVCRQPINPQGAILDAAMRDGSIARCPSEPLQTIVEAGLSICQPKLRIKGNGQPGVVCAVVNGTRTCLRSP